MLTHGFTVGLNNLTAAISGGGLDFSALSNLPVGRQSAVTTAAEAAATTLGVTVQSIIDALAVGRGVASLLPNDGCLLASSGGAVTSQGDPVGAIQSWTGTELATQANVSLQPVSGADGVVANGTKSLLTGDLSSWSEGEFILVCDHDFGGSAYGLFMLGDDSINYWGVRNNDYRIYDTFGTTIYLNPAVTLPTNSGLHDKGIGNIYITSGGDKSFSWNGTEHFTASAQPVSFPSDGTLLNSLTVNYVGVWSAFALNESIYTADQRAAVREFCKEYFGVVY